MSSSATKPPRGRPGKASGSRPNAKRRSKILRAAEQLFRHYGLGKTTVADIARAAKVGVGTVYLEFASKDDIVVELSIQRYRCVIDAMRQAAMGGSSPSERLIAILEVRLDHLHKFAREGQHGGELVRCGCPATERAHNRFRAQEEDLLVEFLTVASGEGALAAADPRRAARVLLRLHDSYVPLLLGASAAVHGELRQELDMAHQLLLQGLLPRD